MTEHEILYRGTRFDLIGMDLPGRDGISHRREFIRHPGAVVLLPMLDDDTLVMIRNERPSVGETLLELPAGTCEPPEPVWQTARRELLEETGYAASELDPVCQFYSAPGLGNELMHLFIARGLTAGEQHLETTERIENRILRRDEIHRLVATHQIRDAKTLIGLQYFLLNASGS